MKRSKLHKQTHRINKQQAMTYQKNKVTFSVKKVMKLGSVSQSNAHKNIYKQKEAIFAKYTK